MRMNWCTYRIIIDGESLKITLNLANLRYFIGINRKCFLPSGIPPVVKSPAIVAPMLLSFASSKVESGMLLQLNMACLDIHK
ncbi:hypothetical protein P8452_52201 [Trifolium repens]|nr:hypothetical protein P8452_52201 [Trifolium repens]